MAAALHTLEAPLGTTSCLARSRNEGARRRSAAVPSLSASSSTRRPRSIVSAIPVARADGAGAGSFSEVVALLEGKLPEVTPPSGKLGVVQSDTKKSSRTVIELRIGTPRPPVARKIAARVGITARGWPECRPTAGTTRRNAFAMRLIEWVTTRWAPVRSRASGSIVSDGVNNRAV
jgi:hypothetical protein